jgi:hypothetical protein
MHELLLLLLLLLLLPALAVLLSARRRCRRPDAEDGASAITRQHIELFQGGELNEAAVETAKARFRALLERGDVAAVEASLRAGTQFVVQVRALAELGTDDAGRILERQLQRRHSDDRLEQALYWIDLANGLRSLNRSQSLPHLLRCAEAAGDLPLAHFFAAETVCFLGFGGYLRQPRTPLGRSALRVLHRALEGLRYSVRPVLVAEARLGELVEGLWDGRADGVDPLAVRVFHESLRFLRRAPHAEEDLPGEGAEREGFSWQVSRLAALEPAMEEYLRAAPAALAARLADASPDEQGDLLRALADLRADCGVLALDLLNRPDLRHAELALEVLTWSSDPRVGPRLRERVLQGVPMVRRAQGRRRASPGRLPSPGGLPYPAVLRTLRGHPSVQTEAFLLLAARDCDPVVRQAAVGSLGWWEPLQRPETLLTLQDARRDPTPEVRQVARAALARLGERLALQWFRQTLAGEDAQRVHDAIAVIADEGLTLLWPDLDRLADADNPEVAHYAREALERLGEELARRPG